MLGATVCHTKIYFYVLNILFLSKPTQLELDSKVLLHVASIYLHGVFPIPFPRVIIQRALSTVIFFEEVTTSCWLNNLEPIVDTGLSVM